jgi:hypothetical protein
MSVRTIEVAGQNGLELTDDWLVQLYHENTKITPASLS